MESVLINTSFCPQMHINSLIDIITGTRQQIPQKNIFSLNDTESYLRNVDSINFTF